MGPHPAVTGGAGRLGDASTIITSTIITSTITEVSVPTTTGPTRRTVLCGLAAALTAPGALAACSSGGGTAAPAAPAAPSSPAAGGGTGLATGQVPVGGGAITTVGDRTVLVVQPTAGTFKAFDAACPHQGTTVDPPRDGVVTCPNHFSQFDAATGALRKGPADTGLTEVPVQVVDDRVQVS